ncbi:MAG TPA: hypothetical protein VE422_27995 [Terriglobia bacterium]|nr:hypothetical protein [Terriglobia bacterium]
MTGTTQQQTPYRIIRETAWNNGQRRPGGYALRISKAFQNYFSQGSKVKLAIHPGVVRTRLLESYGLQLPDEWFVGPERARSLCARLASGRYDTLSGRFLAIDDDLDELLKRKDDITSRELYTLRIQT